MADLDYALVSYLSDKYNGDENGDNDAIMNEIDELPDSASMAGSDKSSASSDSDSGSSSDADTVVDDRKATDEKDKLRRKKKREEKRERKRAKEEKKRKKEKKRESKRKRQEKSREPKEKKRRRDRDDSAIARNLAAAIRAAPVAGEMIARAAVRDDRRRPTRSAPSALFTPTSDMATKSDLARLLELARALRRLDRLVPSALIAATLTAIVDDLALDRPKGRIAEASKNMAPLE